MQKQYNYFQEYTRDNAVKSIIITPVKTSLKPTNLKILWNVKTEMCTAHKLGFYKLILFIFFKHRKKTVCVWVISSFRSVIIVFRMMWKILSNCPLCFSALHLLIVLIFCGMYLVQFFLHLYTNIAIEDILHYVARIIL